MGSNWWERSGTPILWSTATQGSGGVLIASTDGFTAIVNSALTASTAGVIAGTSLTLSSGLTAGALSGASLLLSSGLTSSALTATGAVTFTLSTANPAALGRLYVSSSGVVMMSTG